MGYLRHDQYAGFVLISNGTLKAFFVYTELLDDRARMIQIIMNSALTMNLIILMTVHCLGPTGPENLSSTLIETSQAMQDHLVSGMCERRSSISMGTPLDAQGAAPS